MSRGISNEIEDMLLAQQTRYKIPAGLPEGVLCGNKTGEMDATENDAAIIYAKDCRLYPGCALEWLELEGSGNHTDSVGLIVGL